MASFVRLAARLQGCRTWTSHLARQQRLAQPCSLISTSKKNTDSATLPEAVQNSPELKEKVPLQERDENWISFGYSLVDKDEDKLLHFAVLFMGITVCICWGGFVLAYQPDHRLGDWACREAYLELARREKEGLPLVDPNLISLDKVELPSDEELGDTDIII